MMTRLLHHFAIVIAVIFFCADSTAPSSFAKSKGDKSTASKKRNRKAKLIYKPPLRGAPSRRVYGGTRGDSRADRVLRIWAPDHVGLTAQSTPTLYFQITDVINDGIELIVTTDSVIDPLIEQYVDPPIAAGLYAVPLSNFALELELGVVYQWSIAQVRDLNGRSRDTVALGYFRRCDPLAAAEAATALDLAALQAEQGIWYDAVDTLVRAVRANPEDGLFRDALDALLEQIGLDAPDDAVEIREVDVK